MFGEKIKTLREKGVFFARYPGINYFYGVILHAA
jgi:hypothetical protein